MPNDNTEMLESDESAVSIAELLTGEPAIVDRVRTETRAAPPNAHALQAPARVQLPASNTETLARLRREPARFETLGAQLQAIVRSARGFDDDRLVAAAQGLNGTLNEEGGFLLQPDFSQELIGSIYEEAVLAPLCDRRETAHRFRKHYLPAINETSRAEGSRWGGCRAYWQHEADEMTPSRPKFAQLGLSMKRLTGLSIASAELVADAPAMEGHLRRAFQSEMSFKVDEAVLSGGAGVPLGLLNSGALITVGKEVGQAAATIVGENIDAMWARLPLPSRRRAVWLVSEDAEAKIPSAASAEANYRPAGSDGIEWPRLYGRPVMAIEQAQPLGTAGDIVLADLSQYILLDGGTAPAVSVDVYFVKDEVVFRFVLYVDGQPGWRTPILPFNGSAVTRSPFVALQTRA